MTLAHVLDTVNPGIHYHEKKLQLKISNSRWLAYATAGLATAAGSAPSVEAEIHYSGRIHHWLRVFNPGASFPLSGGANLVITRVEDSEGISNRMFVGYANTEGVRVTGGLSVSKLTPREVISHGHFTSSGILIGDEGSGYFAPLGPGFAGFRFDVGNGTQYGWVRIKTIQVSPLNEIEIQGYAWADPGEEIKAGQTTDNSSLPAEESLGALAFGAAGVVAWRRRRLTAQRTRFHFPAL